MFIFWRIIFSMNEGLKEMGLEWKDAVLPKIVPS